MNQKAPKPALAGTTHICRLSALEQRKIKYLAQGHNVLPELNLRPYDRDQITLTTEPNAFTMQEPMVYLMWQHLTHSP